MPKPPEMMFEKDGRGLVPAKSNGVLDTTYEAYLTEIGVESNQSVQIALAQSEDPRFVKFLEIMGRPPLNVRHPQKIQTIAKDCGITMSEFANWFRRSASAIATAKAQLHAIELVGDMVVDARSSQESCERCDGLKWVNAPPDLPVDTPGYRILMSKWVERKNKDTGETEKFEEIIYCRTCPKCGGTGKTRKIGDEHARDKTLEMAGLITKGRAAVQITQNFGGAGHASAVQQLNAVTIDVEAEEIPEDEGGSGTVQ